MSGSEISLTCQVCKRWREAMTHEEVWLHADKRHFPDHQSVYVLELQSARQRRGSLLYISNSLWYPVWSKGLLHAVACAGIRCMHSRQPAMTAVRLLAALLSCKGTTSQLSGCVGNALWQALAPVAHSGSVRNEISALVPIFLSIRHPILPEAFQQLPYDQQKLN